MEAKIMAVIENQSEKMEEKKETTIQYHIRPSHYLDYDYDTSEFTLEVHIPGVAKSDIKIKFLEDAFSIEARRDTALYSISEYLPFDINVKSIKADYDNGLLRITGHIKNPLDEAYDIKISA